MKIAIFELCSSLHKETLRPANEDPFICALLTELKTVALETVFCGNDFSSYGKHDCDVIFVRTGGTEGLFKALNLPRGHVILLTSGQSNSLAASMEILAYLRSRSGSGEILHGSSETLAQRLLALAGKADTNDRSCCGSFIQKMPDVNLGGIKLGVIGQPSDWLIASKVDYGYAQRKFNVNLVDIPMAALTDKIFAMRDAKGTDLRSFAGSELIYDALKALVKEYDLSGLTLRCFDLLDSVHNTGCLALARLNAEGFACSCEGDIPALLSMVYLKHQRGCPGFQCNLSQIKGKELLFAHCTIPLNMCTSYAYNTHFESGIGTAIKGELPLGPVEIFKIAPSLDDCVRIPGRIVRNCSLPNLCRTQIVVEADAAEYFLTQPLANHHIVVKVTEPSNSL